MRKVFVFGTSHCFQRYSGREVSDCVFKFILAISAYCAKLNVKCIAEEMSVEALGRGFQSSCQKVSFDVCISHQFCDPDSTKRDELGVRDINLINSDCFLQGLSDELCQAEIRRNHAIRELYWYGRLISSDTWPVIFVCGAEHVNPFSLLLEDKGIAVQVIESDWIPT